jgi:hypothetical protein
LVLVEEPEKKHNEQNENEIDLTVPAPKNPKKKRKEVAYELKKEQLSILIKTTFDIIGTRPGLEMWKLSQKEAELIAEPMSGLMNKNPFFDRITSEYGEWIALIVALGTVIIPRAFIMIAANPKKEKEKIKPYVPIAENNRKQAGPGEPSGAAKQSGPAPISSGKYIGDSSASGKNFNSQLHELIPSIQ